MTEETRVYRLETCTDDFQALVLDYSEDDDRLDQYEFVGRSLRESWEPPKCYVFKQRLRKPDIWALVETSALACNRTALDVFEPFMGRTVELLPIDCPDEPDLMLLNILEDINCLDRRTSEESLGLFTKYSFISHRLPESGLFKIPATDDVKVLYVDRSSDELTLRERIEESGLTGIAFRLLWSNLEGAASSLYLAGCRMARNGVVVSATTSLIP